MIEYFIDIDKKLFIILNNLGSETWDFFWLLLSNRMVIFYVIMLFLIYYCYKLEINKIFFIIFFFIICLGVTDFMHVRLFKNLFMRLRPCFEPDIVSQMRPLLLECGGQYGFVSGHAANTAAMVTFLIYSFKHMNKFSKYILLIWMLFVSYSRIYLGKHYPLDIVFGIAFGFLIGVLTFNICQIFLNEKHIK